MRSVSPMERYQPGEVSASKSMKCDEVECWTHRMILAMVACNGRWIARPGIARALGRLLPPARVAREGKLRVGLTAGVARNQFQGGNVSPPLVLPQFGLRETGFSFYRFALISGSVYKTKLTSNQSNWVQTGQTTTNHSFSVTSLYLHDLH
jgi:hypothetical protein